MPQGHTVDGRNSATVDNFPDFQIFEFSRFFGFPWCVWGSGSVSNRQEIAWRFIWTNSQPGKWHMSPFSMILICFDGFPRSPDSVLTRYLLYFDEVGQMSLASVSGVEPKRCATRNEADSWWCQLGKCIFRSVYGHLRFFSSDRFWCMFFSSSFCS